ncbi:MAG: V-type ATPase subunit [Thermoplasmata archaeon]|nr:V-type ATPase subunit [Thermoplasmata archaeon]
MDIIVYLAIVFSAIAVAVMVQRSLPYVKFAYPTAKAEAVGNPFLSEKVLNQLLESRNITSFKNAVNSYKDFFIEGERIEEIHTSLDEYMIQSVESLKKESPKGLEEFYDRFTEFLDSQSLKSFVKSKIIGVDIDIRPFSKTFARWIDQMKKLEKKEILEFLVEKEILADTSVSGDPLEIDVQIDRYVLKRMHESKVPKVAESTKKEFVEILTDIINIRNVLMAKINNLDVEKCKKLFLGEGREIPRWKFDEMCTSKDVEDMISRLQGTTYYEPLRQGYEDSKKYGNMELIEISLDKVLLGTVKDLSNKNFPFFGPLLKFIVFRYYEIRNLKVISKGVYEHLSKDRIKPLLVTGG